MKMNLTLRLPEGNINHVRPLVVEEVTLFKEPSSSVYKLQVFDEMNICYFFT